LEDEKMLKDKENPGPGKEVEFWSRKSHNLNSIHNELNGDKIKNVMDVLEVIKTPTSLCLIACAKKCL